MQTQLLGRSSLIVLAAVLAGGEVRAEEVNLVSGPVSVVQVDQTVPPQAEPAAAQAQAKRVRLRERRELWREKWAEGEAPADNTEGGDDIVVRGIRSSLAEARDEKRNSDQIVDVVKAEDVGKLPANTVGDVLSYIPGIQVGRDEGEVSDIQVRGLGTVQTTINGAEAFSSLDRNLQITDLPADLIKSVEVYKTSSPSQVEGSGSGSINISLRRPTDFKRGFSVFTIATGRYNNQSKKFFQNYTGIVNYRASTGIGEMGLMLNVTYNTNPFLESRAYNDVLGTVQTRQDVGAQILPYPTLAPSQVYFQYATGSRTTTSYTASAQWKPSSQLSITLEGNYNKIRLDRTYNQLYLPVQIQSSSTSTLASLSNIVLVPGTNRIASATVAPVTQLGPIFNYRVNPTDQYYARFGVDYNSDQFTLSTQVNYNYANSPVSDQYIRNRFVNRPIYDIEFASTKFKYPQMNVAFRNLDLLDPSQYRFTQFDESVRTNKGSLIEGRVDLTLRPGSKLIDNIQVGVRGSRRTAERVVRTRSLGNMSIPFGQMPDGYKSLVPIAQGFEGTGVENNARWLGYESSVIRANLPQLYNYLNAIELQRGVATPVFGDPVPPLNYGDYFNGTETVLAFYGQARYSFKALFPIDGVIGVRAINTMVDLDSVSRVVRSRIVNGVNTTATDIVPNVGRQNGLDITPSASMVTHFTNNVQLRLSYTRAISRPRMYDLTPNLSYDETRPGNVATGGNADLKPAVTNKFDASLEFYFGRTGQIAIAPFYWKLNRTIGTFQSFETFPELPDVIFTVARPRNAGKGYRRGFEVQGQTFFTFLPGFMKSFGVSGNYTYVDSRLEYPADPQFLNLPSVVAPLTNVAKNSYTIMGLFERGGLSGRLAYNWRGKLVTDIRSPLRNSDYLLPVSWLELNISYQVRKGPFKNLSVGLQAQNLQSSARRTFYGYPDQPKEVTYMAKTYGLTTRYNF